MRPATVGQVPSATSSSAQRDRRARPAARRAGGARSATAPRASRSRRRRRTRHRGTRPRAHRARARAIAERDDQHVERPDHEVLSAEQRDQGAEAAVLPERHQPARARPRGRHRRGAGDRSRPRAARAARPAQAPARAAPTRRDAARRNRPLHPVRRPRSARRRVPARRARSTLSTQPESTLIAVSCSERGAERGTSAACAGRVDGHGDSRRRSPPRIDSASGAPLNSSAAVAPSDAACHQ